MTTTTSTQQQAVSLLNEAGTAYRIQPNGVFVIAGRGIADHEVVKLWGSPTPGSTQALRTATVADIVTRLTNTTYAMTKVDALGWGMGGAQNDIHAAVDAAIEAGLVEVVRTVGADRFVALVKPVPVIPTPRTEWVDLYPDAGLDFGDVTDIYMED